MLIGYARACPNDADAFGQLQALHAAGCETVFIESATGGRWQRPELDRLLGQLRRDDVVVVWRLDRLARSLADVLMIMEQIDRAGAGSHGLVRLCNACQSLAAP
jgi:DNA invertase Pin-like site-specific DNA recombinase